MLTMSTTKLYCTWFCPFAQRVWIALNYKKVPHTYIEQNCYEKSPEWLAISPRGLVPCLVNEGKSVYESSVCLEYIDEYWTNGPSLLPKDPYARAVVRIWSDHVTKKIVPNFYALLMKQTEEERNVAKEDLLAGLKSFQDAISDGPFFSGPNFGMVDIMLTPFALRMSQGNASDALRGFTLPDGPEFVKLQKWWNAVQAVPGFQSTVPDTEKLIENYRKYANNTAQTSGAVAIRQGKPMP